MKSVDIIRLFDHLKNDQNMHTDAYSDGCIQRTWKILKKVPEACFVIFLEENEEGICCLETGTIWRQHYVPVVFDEQQTPLVLDVCLMDGPESLEDYKMHFKNASLLCGPEVKMGLGDLEPHSSETAQSILDKISANEKNKIAPNKIKSKWLKNFYQKQQIKKLREGIYKR